MNHIDIISVWVTKLQGQNTPWNWILIQFQTLLLRWVILRLFLMYSKWANSGEWSAKNCPDILRVMSLSRESDIDSCPLLSVLTSENRLEVEQVRETSHRARVSGDMSLSLFADKWSRLGHLHWGKNETIRCLLVRIASSYEEVLGWTLLAAVYCIDNEQSSKEAKHMYQNCSRCQKRIKNRLSEWPVLKIHDSYQMPNTLPSTKRNLELETLQQGYVRHAVRKT